MDKKDQKYIERILKGETEVFSVLVDKYSHPIFQLILGIIHNREDAEELTQDCFLKMYRTLDKFKGECQFSTWIYRIAYTTAISATRKKKREYLYIEEQTINQIADQEIDQQFEYEIREDQLEALHQAMNCLMPEERAILQLFYTEQKNIEEITVITNLSQSNIKVKLHRLRKKLYVILNKERENLL